MNAHNNSNDNNDNKNIIIMIINLRMNKAERSPKTLTRPKS